MPRLALTAKTVVALRAPTLSGKSEIHWDYGDDAVRGFGVYCSGTTSTKSYIAQRDIKGRSVRVTLAGVNEIGIKEARNRAAALQLEMRQGRDPKVTASCATLEATLDEFRAKRALKARSVDSYNDLIKRHLADWLTLPMTSITRTMVETRHNEITSEVENRFREKARASAQRYRDRAHKAKRWPEAQQRYFELAEKAESREPPNGFATANATMRALRALFKIHSAIHSRHVRGMMRKLPSVNIHDMAYKDY